MAYSSRPACGKAHRTFIAQVPALRWAVVGKLPTTTGWQPVLLSEQKRTRAILLPLW